MRVRILPSRAVGAVRVPPSKSVAHRMLVCAALAKGESAVHGVGDCEDVRATLDCLCRMGAHCEKEGETVRLSGGLLTAQPSEILPCRESGSTLRFLIPIALTSPYPIVFSCEGRLPKRPQTVYERLCRERGLTFLQSGDLWQVCGRLSSGDYTIEGDISSQFITGLLFALPLLGGESRLRLLPPVESRPYIDLTLDVLSRFGIRAEWEDDRTLRIPSGQHYSAADCEVEGDWSSGAFWAALGRLGENRVELIGLDPNSKQGDRACIPYLDALMAGGQTISLADQPDLGPILFAFAAMQHGGSFSEVGRLRIKESDRIRTMREELAKCGVVLTDLGDRVMVDASGLHAPTLPFDGHGDHRVVMSLAILATRTGGEITGAEAVAKSYPDFWAHLASLGVSVETREE